MRSARPLVLALALAPALAGCHLIFPFDLADGVGVDVDGGDAGGVDARAADALGDGSRKEAAVSDGAVADTLPPCVPKPRQEVCSPDGWCWQHPVPQGNHLRAVHAAGGTFFAVGAAGTRLTRVGGVWRGQTSRLIGAFNGVWAHSAQIAFAVGTEGLIHHYAQGAWSDHSLPTALTLNAVAGSSANDVWAVGAGGAVYRHDGTGWAKDTAASALTVVDLLGVWVAPTGEIFIVGDSGTWITYDGAAWKTLPTYTTGNINAVWGTSKSDVWLVGDTGYLLHFNGTSTSSYTPPKATNYRAVWGSGAKDVHAVGQGGTGAHFDGMSWKPLSQGTALTINGAWGAGAGGPIIGVGDEGAIIELKAGVWTSVNKVVKSNEIFFADVWGSDRCNVLAAGTQLHRFGGAGWQVDRIFGNTIWGIWGSGPGDVWLVGATTIEHFNGKGWGTPESPTEPLLGVWGAGPQDVWAVGEKSMVMHRTGGAWKQVTPTGVTSLVTLNAVWGSSASDVHAVGFDRYMRWDGKTLTGTDSPSTNLRGIWGHAPDKIWAVGVSCLFRRFDGTKWVTPPSAQQPCDYSTLPNAQLWDITGDGKGRLFVVGASGVIRRFDGATWSEVDSGTTNELRAIWGPPGSEMDLVAVGRSGTILWRAK